jgi:quercetin dioxygenase-like cupin family protein
MDGPGIWHVLTVDAENRPAADQSFKNTFLVHTPRSSTNVTHILAGGGVRPHVHREHDEIIVVIEGAGEFRLGDEVKSIGPGDVIVAPAGAIHGPTSNSPRFVFLSVFAPEFDPANPDRVFLED